MREHEWALTSEIPMGRPAAAAAATETATTAATGAPISPSRPQRDDADVAKRFEYRLVETTTKIFAAQIHAYNILRLISVSHETWL